MRSRTITKNCEQCGADYAPEYGRTTRFCSRDCYLVNRWGTMPASICEHCGTEYRRRRRSSVYCSVECRATAQVGATRERRLIRYGSGGRYRARRVPEHPHADGKGYVMEHRLVMEAVIGRHLSSDEVVHHVDEDPANNDPSNLRIMTKAEHDSLHSVDRWQSRREGLPG